MRFFSVVEVTLVCIVVEDLHRQGLHRCVACVACREGSRGGRPLACREVPLNTKLRESRTEDGEEISATARLSIEIGSSTGALLKFSLSILCSLWSSPWR